VQDVDEVVVEGEGDNDGELLLLLLLLDKAESTGVA
jgi:hypothetical protein